MAKARRKALVAHSPNPSNRTSKFKGVTRHRLTGRFEAHLWDKDCWNSSLGKKGKQVYLGAYDDEKDAAKAHDLAALKFWGPATTVVNFPLSTYSKALAEMENLSKEEYLALLRRNSSGFSRGVSKYRGVARHHQNGRWEARIGRVLGNKYLYLGTYDTQEEAAAAYDRAAIQHRGPNAVTNFDISVYVKELQDEEPLISRDLDEISPPNIPKFDTHALVSLNSSQDFGLLVDTGTFGDYTVENTEMEALFEFSVTSGLADSSSTANDDADTEASKIHMFGIKQSTEQELSGVDNHHDYILSNSIDPLVLEEFSSCSHNISSQD